MTGGGLTFKTCSGRAIEPWLGALARLRIEVFRDFPYLYDGSLDYEENYLRAYVESPDSLAVLACDGDTPVGATTALPLADETEEFRRPFEAAGYDVGRVFYCAESVLLKSHRGRGVYARFFAAREDHARALGRFDWSAFCAVQRPDDHPLRPADYAPLDPVWARYGYVRHPELRTSFAWKDIGETRASAKPMVFWLKPLREICA